MWWCGGVWEGEGCLIEHVIVAMNQVFDKLLFVCVRVCVVCVLCMYVCVFGVCVRC